MIICDVCDSHIIISHLNVISDDEYIKIICPECGFDNSYQVAKRGYVKNALTTFIEDNFLDGSDFDEMVDYMVERFGIQRDRVIELLEEYEIRDSGFSIKGDILDEL